MQTKINSLNFIFSLYFCCCSEWKDLLNITVLSNVAWPTSVNEPLSLYGPLWTFVFHCSRVHRHHTCLNKMLLGTMHWPEEDVFSTIILQLWGKKEENLIFENEDFLSDSSDNVNPLQLKLNLAAVVLFVPNQWLDISTMLSTCRQEFFLTLIFFYFFFFRAHATTGIFQVLGTAETLRNKCYNFNRGDARLQTDFQYKRSDSRDHSLQFSASSALKRC